MKDLFFYLPRLLEARLLETESKLKAFLAESKPKALLAESKFGTSKIGPSKFGTSSKIGPSKLGILGILPGIFVTVTIGTFGVTVPIGTLVVLYLTHIFFKLFYHNYSFSDRKYG